MNSKLQKAVEIFKELGWEKANDNNVMKLPLGTKEQRKIALAGLKTGNFREYGKLENGDYGVINHTDVNKDYLAVFAVLIGVDARRASNILSIHNQDLVFDVISSRGEKYASDFIIHACNSSRRVWEHSASVFGVTAVNLVYKLNLDIPQNVEYMKDWSCYMTNAMGLASEIRGNKEKLPTFKIMKERFTPHIVTGISVNSAATGPFGEVLQKGYEMGLLTKDSFLEYVFSAMDSAVRPGDRKVWIEALEKFEVTDDELFSRIETLIPIIATGDNVAVNKLAPRLIKVAKDNELIEVLIASFSTKTKKAKEIILKSASERPCPKDVETIAPWLNMFANENDKGISKKAKALIEKWGIEEIEEKEVEAEIEGLWNETPSLWEVPDFEVGEVSQEELTEILAELVKRSSGVTDVLEERFLAMANALAYKDVEECKLSLSGVKKSNATGIVSDVVCWVDGTIPFGLDCFDKDEIRISEPINARNVCVAINLDKIPCILSTPSKIDLSICLSDLVKRLTIYKEKGLAVIESDLLLALARLNVDTKTDKDIKALENLKLPILLQSGEKMSVNTRDAILRYLDNPVKDEDLVLELSYRYIFKSGFQERSFYGFPDRFTNNYGCDDYSIFPLLGDIVLGSVCWGGEFDHIRGLNNRQAVKRAKPLPPKTAINLLFSQCKPVSNYAAEDLVLSVTEAWERGILVPKVADVKYLYLKDGSIKGIVALAEVFDLVAREGLLSVVWPLLDDIIKASLKATRLVSGTAEIAELILEFLPEVVVAIEKDIADKNALDLLGIRELSERKGSSKAVTIAKKIVEKLPQIENTIVKIEDNNMVMEVPFEDVWKISENKKAPIMDNVKIKVECLKESKVIKYIFQLPDIKDKKFEIIKDRWFYDLEYQGQCEAYPNIDNENSWDRKDSIWLHYDTKKEKIVVLDKREKSYDVMSISLLTVSLGLLSQDGGDATYYSKSILEKYVKTGYFTDEVVSIAVKTLLECKDINPAKLVRTLEKDIKYLPVLYPILFESLNKAKEIVEDTGKPPTWLSRILGVMIRYFAYFIEAEKRGIVSLEETKNALKVICLCKVKSVSVEKSKELMDLLK